MNFLSPLEKDSQTVGEIKKLIENIDADIRKHNHFVKIKDTNITGVPVRFALIPIKQLLDIKIEKLYVKLKGTTIDKFTVMLQEIQDFNFFNCIRNRVFDSYSVSGNIIFNENSEILKSIGNYKNGLINITTEFLKKAMDTLKEYKI